ncbi:MAG: aspartate carbamoyltransferase [Anaerolineales bacterium]
MTFPASMVDFVERYTPPPIAGDFTGKPIITVEQFARRDLDIIFEATRKIRAGVRHDEHGISNLCAHRVMAMLFFEASTRTDMSFQAAMSRLGGRVIGASNGISFSSVYKGENLPDTVRAAGCYADVVVLRHPAEGATYLAAYYLDMLAQHIGRRPILISAGDGIGEHPTQALLDLFTLLDSEGGVDDLNITLVGDLKYGRTVHSLAKLIGLFEAPDTTLNFVAPAGLEMPQSIRDFLDTRPVQFFQTDQLDDVLADSDVIYWTRVQEERFDDPAQYAAIADAFVMTPDILARAKPDAILMHPLPRKHEMGTPQDHDILDNDPRAAYFRQMENGMFVRMALLAKTLGVSII